MNTMSLATAHLCAGAALADAAIAVIEHMRGNEDVSLLFCGLAPVSILLATFFYRQYDRFKQAVPEDAE